jgi:hypothetical protein
MLADQSAISIANSETGQLRLAAINLRRLVNLGLTHDTPQPGGCSPSNG